jgi:hypothetical protein
MYIVPSGKTLAAWVEGLIPEAPLTPRQTDDVIGALGRYGVLESSFNCALTQPLSRSQSLHNTHA